MRLSTNEILRAQPERRCALRVLLRIQRLERDSKGLRDTLARLGDPALKTRSVGGESQLDLFGQIVDAVCVPWIKPSPDHITIADTVGPRRAAGVHVTRPKAIGETRAAVRRGISSRLDSRNAGGSCGRRRAHVIGSRGGVELRDLAGETLGVGANAPRPVGTASSMGRGSRSPPSGSSTTATRTRHDREPSATRSATARKGKPRGAGGFEAFVRSAFKVVLQHRPVSGEPARVAPHSDCRLSITSTRRQAKTAGER